MIALLYIIGYLLSWILILHNVLKTEGIITVLSLMCATIISFGSWISVIITLCFIYGDAVIYKNIKIMRKQLKPGQLCTIGGHIYRCSKHVKKGEPVCVKCTEFYRERRGIYALPPCDNSCYISRSKCIDLFGGYPYLGLCSYPILVK